ncbi:chemotaxis protein CheW [Aquabacterium sp. A3]|uniref:chemotaxis protein CheW n=1 Tax=Aquabacterium sp. A3 TaxID=3132829 RepID=UPI003119968C
MSHEPLRHYGGFELAGMSMALPLTSLREVHPWCELVEIPSPSAAVMGALSLRGTLVPVVNLSTVLSRGPQIQRWGCLIVMVHEGQIMALAADAVTGVFSCEPSTLHPMRGQDPVASILAANVYRSDQDREVCLLSVASVFSLPGVVSVVDPEPQRQQVGEGLLERSDDSHPLMLLRCGRVPMAIDAMAVAGTIPAPALRPSALAQGHCLGVVSHAGRDIPAVDLQSLCGLGAMDVSAGMQAFVLTLDEGEVALLMGEVLDVVRAPAESALHVPAYALPARDLFEGAVPTSALSEDVVKRLGMQVSQFLWLSAQGLRQHPALISLASMSDGQTSSDHAHGFKSASLAQSMLTYALGGDAATPLEQVSEILPYDPGLCVFAQQGALLGILVNRGRSIPVMCLSRLTGLASPEVSPAVSVLVVVHEGQHVGFAVPALRSIEPSDWSPELPAMGQPGGDPLAQALSGRRLVQVGVPGQQRMLPLLDLQQAARSLIEQGQREAVAA